MVCLIINKDVGPICPLPKNTCFFQHRSTNRCMADKCKDLNIEELALTVGLDPISDGEIHRTTNLIRHKLKMENLKFLSLQDVINQEKLAPIWAINDSPNSSVDHPGDITIPIPGKNGVNYLHVPMTWIPIELTSQVPREQILESVELRHALSEGLIAFISEKDATTIMKEKGAKEERKRLRELRDQIRLAASKSMTTEATVNSEQVSSKNPKIDLAFEKWVDKMAKQSDGKILNELRIRRTFKIAQLKHMKAEFTGKMKTLEFIESALSEKRSKKATKTQ